MRKPKFFTRLINIESKEHVKKLDSIFYEFDFSLEQHFEENEFIAGNYFIHFVNDYDRFGEVKIRVISFVDIENILNVNQTVNRYNIYQNEYEKYNKPFILLQQNKFSSYEEREDIRKSINIDALNLSEDNFNKFSNGQI